MMRSVSNGTVLSPNTPHINLQACAPVRPQAPINRKLTKDAAAALMQLRNPYASPSTTPRAPPKTSYSQASSQKRTPGAATQIRDAHAYRGRGDQEDNRSNDLGDTDISQEPGETDEEPSYTLRDFDINGESYVEYEEGDDSIVLDREWAEQLAEEAGVDLVTTQGKWR